MQSYSRVAAQLHEHLTSSILAQLVARRAPSAAMETQVSQLVEEAVQRSHDQFMARLDAQPKMINCLAQGVGMFFLELCRGEPQEMASSFNPRSRLQAKDNWLLALENRLCHDDYETLPADHHHHSPHAHSHAISPALHAESGSQLV